MKNALVLAGSEGIGFGIAASLVETGHNVTIVSRNPDKLRRASERLGGCNFICCDLINIEDVSELIEKIKNIHFHCYIINSGGPKPGDYDSLKSEGLLAATIDIVNPALKILDAVLPKMREHNFGRVVNISSVGLIRPIVGLAASNSSRGLLHNLLSGIALEEINRGITINEILPGIIWTPRQKFLAEHDADAKGCSVEDVLTSKKSMVPAGRFGSPSDIGKLAAFLCSENAGYITGQAIAVDGGLLGVSR